MDILGKLFESYLRWAGHLAPNYVTRLLRLVLLFGLPVALAAGVFMRGNRRESIQILSGVVGVLLAASLPLHRLEIHNYLVRGWLIALSVVALCFLPSALTFLMVPHAGMQRQVRRGLYILMVVLLLGIITQKGVAP